MEKIIEVTGFMGENDDVVILTNSLIVLERNESELNLSDGLINKRISKQDTKQINVYDAVNKYVFRCYISQDKLDKFVEDRFIPYIKMNHLYY